MIRFRWKVENPFDQLNEPFGRYIRWDAKGIVRIDGNYEEHLFFIQSSNP